MIYYVEDDTNLQKVVVYTLQNTGFEAKGFDDGASMMQALQQQLPQLILLDIMLPQEDGLTILQRLRKNAATRKIPVIMLTAKGTEYDTITGLDSGADDYITKPFGVMELVSRIKAVLRRVQDDAVQTEYEWDGIAMSLAHHRVTVDGKSVDLTRKEFDLLHLLLKHPGKVFTRDAILEHVWGHDFYGETRTIDVHMQTLRSKLGTKADAIKTIRGLGYKLGGVQ